MHRSNAIAPEPQSSDSGTLSIPVAHEDSNEASNATKRRHKKNSHIIVNTNTNEEESNGEAVELQQVEKEHRSDSEDSSHYHRTHAQKLDELISIMARLSKLEAAYKHKEEHQRKIHKERLPRKEWHYKLFKTPKEATEAIVAAGEKKAKVPLDKLIVLGFLAGIFVSFGGTFALSVSQGLPHADPGVQKLLLGLTFAVALLMIVFFGGELFTGNTMYMTAGLLHGKVSWKGLAYSWFCSYFANWMGCALGAYLFGYVTELFVHDPWLTNVKHIAEAKTSYEFQVVFIRAIGANWLVCLAIFIAICAEDVGGKILAMLIIVATFAASSFEHCIANMYFIDLGLMYGADTTFGRFIYKNLIPATLGNIVGGALGVGLPAWYLYGWRPDAHERENEVFMPACLLPMEV